jgi:xanthine dehydrogenase accessory factor
LAHLGFTVVVIDDREEFADKSIFPDAEDVILSEFDDLDGKLEVHENDYIAIMTRGHIGDRESEKFALGTPASYIGVVGSRTKTAFVNAKLVEEGISLEEIKKRVTTPIGLDIGSETPAEIAVSIAAQLISVRAKKL